MAESKCGLRAKRKSATLLRIYFLTIFFENGKLIISSEGALNVEKEEW
jgi:hypothetical protein